jgi:hypothetical protein
MAVALTSNTFLVFSGIEKKTEIIFSREAEGLLKSDVTRPEILEALRRLEEISSLQKDWDSYGAEAPAKAAIFAGRRFIASLDRLQKAAPFFVAPIPDGGIQMEWQGQDVALEVEINPAGDSFNYLKIVGRGTADRKSEEKHNVSAYQILERIDSVILK